MKTALLFPGQGSQRVGMGRDLAHRFDVARRTYEEADEALGFSISSLCFDGPEDDLTLTQHSQPAILATSMAVFRVLSTETQLDYAAVAGHSLGEWTALAAAGTLSFADAIRLVHLRGRFMQEAVPVGLGGMAALMGLDLDGTISLCSEASRVGEPCEPANYNGGGQIVISGHADAIDRAVAAAKGKGAKRAVKLSVSAPFHCSLMGPAADRLAEALVDISFAAPRVPVYANVTAAPTQDPEQLRALLVDQVTGAVRWEESVKALAADGVTRALELGAGSVLRGLVKRIADGIDVTTIGEPHEVDAFVGKGN